MTEDIVRTLVAERGFLEAQIRKLSQIIRDQEEQIADLRTANQDLKYQITKFHDAK